MRPNTGLALGERYRLTRRIAIGGMGEVWVADDGYLGREVAVKVLREEYTGNEDFLRRLRTEARNSAALSHPNIAQMYDYGEQDGAGFLVMELVLGEPLADLLEREPVVAPRKLLPILAATARGLHHAHLAKVVHRDVKPGNILLEHGGNVKITDFGVSLAANQAPMTATGMVMGTAQYLSPEQAVGQAATAASDLYALGVVAYEATAGKRPFTGSTPVDIAVAHVNAPVPPLPTHVHPGLAEVIGRMLEKDPARRPESAASLAGELESLAREIAEDPLGARSRSARRVAAARQGARPARAVPAHAAPAPPRPAGPATPASAAMPVAWASVTPPADERAAAAEPAPATPEDELTPQTPVDGTAAGRSYPLRRDVHAGGHDARRPAVRKAQPGPAGTRSRSAARSAPEAKQGGRRTSTSTGQRFGPLGRLSWPLLALLGLLVVLLLATVVQAMAADAEGQAGQAAAFLAGPVLALSRSSRTGAPPSSGMMLRDTPRAPRTAMTEKDF
ncbi:serine/threonine-protein kinase [Krasilnikoviella flava]|uniref:non-specific serine/threonine protein kinase n=1 Tax=Krasilnikoviella flava TaxID=526729 RepID=A0A1T5KCV6_9MICO|nr:serine/threonine-protein kinase [Krasilnikoviella flava]SKC61552.1 serine/threonine protein kinase [Krasilnikoviella flava]